MAAQLSMPIVMCEVISAGADRRFDWAEADMILRDLPGALESEDRRLLEDEVGILAGMAEFATSLSCDGMTASVRGGL